MNRIFKAAIATLVSALVIGLAIAYVLRCMSLMMTLAVDPIQTHPPKYSLGT